MITLDSWLHLAAHFSFHHIRPGQRWLPLLQKMPPLPPSVLVPVFNLTHWQNQNTPTPLFEQSMNYSQPNTAILHYCSWDHGLGPFLRMWFWFQLLHTQWLTTSEWVAWWTSMTLQFQGKSWELALCSDLGAKQQKTTEISDRNMAASLLQ